MELTCRFRNHYLSEKYTCEVDYINLKPGTIIKSITGQHEDGKTNLDVHAIWFSRLNHSTYLLRGFSNIFPNLTFLRVYLYKLKEITRDDLVGLENLEELDASYCGLTFLPDNLFEGMRKLKVISFSNNKLVHLSSKLLKPLLLNQMSSINFENNPNINSFYDSGDKEGSVNSLEDLMDIIDKNCGPPIPSNGEIFTTGTKTLWASKKFTDFTIVVGEKKIHVHKNILAIHSSVFMAMLGGVNKESLEGKMFIDDFSAEVVEEFLRYIYTGKIPNEKLAMDLFAIAAKYNVIKLKREFELMVLQNIDESNAYEVLVLGNLYESENMKKLAFTELNSMRQTKDLPSELINQPDRLKEYVEAKRECDRQLNKLL